MSSTILRGAALAVLAGAALLGGSGCLLGTETIGSGRATRTWHDGKLSKVYEADYERAWNACSGAIDEFKFAILERHYDMQTGFIKARRTDDLVVRVEIERESSTGKGVRVSVGVGFWGTDRERRSSTEILDAIDRRMGQ